MNFIGLTLESYASILKTISSKEDEHPYWYQIKGTNKNVIVDKKDEPYYRYNPLYRRVSFREVVMIGHFLKDDLKETSAYLENTFQAMKIITDRKSHNVKKQPFQKRCICAIWDSIWNKWTTPFGYVRTQDIAKNLIGFFNEKMNENRVASSISLLSQKKITNEDTKEEIKDTKKEKREVINSVSNPIDKRTPPNTNINSNTPKDNYEEFYSNIQVRSSSRKSIANKYLQTLNNNSAPPPLKQNSSGKLPTLQLYKEKKGLELDEKHKSIIFNQIKTFKNPPKSTPPPFVKKQRIYGLSFFFNDAFQRNQFSR